MSQVPTLSVVVALLVAAACDPGALTSAPSGWDPEFPDLDAGDEWTTGDGGGGEEAALGGDSEVGDAGPDSGIDEDTAGCVSIDWPAYQIEGSCPGLPPAGSIEQTGCELTIPDDLGLVIGPTGTIDGAIVSTTSCSGVTTIGDGPAVELTCLVDAASCTVELASGLDNGFD